MGVPATYQTLLELIVLAIPAAVILTLIFLWRQSRRHRRGALPPRPREMWEPTPAISQPLPDTIAPPEAPPAQKPLERPESIAAKIDSAMAQGEKTALAGLYLDLAGAYDRAGDQNARMEALRSAAGNGALHGPHSAHAAARLALGEAAHEAGDLIGACEQWQLARTASLESGDAAQHAMIEKRMRDNGCPTDWVLTDF
ncbi:MAG: hypothetical protein JSR78_06485 [Proteobacteria bacterium]|nr:hypothetical protein [Pseudomonadota bacterium]